MTPRIQIKSLLFLLLIGGALWSAPVWSMSRPTQYHLYQIDLKSPKTHAQLKPLIRALERELPGSRLLLNGQWTHRDYYSGRLVANGLAYVAVPKVLGARGRSASQRECDFDLKLGALPGVDGAGLQHSSRVEFSVSAWGGSLRVDMPFGNLFHLDRHLSVRTGAEKLILDKATRMQHYAGASDVHSARELLRDARKVRGPITIALAGGDDGVPQRAVNFRQKTVKVTTTMAKARATRRRGHQ